MQLSNRREFLKAVGLTIGTASLLPRYVRGEAMGLPPGIQLYTVREDLPKDTPGTLKQLRDIGFREVETAGFGKYSVQDFRKLLEDAGLKCPSAHLNMNAANLGPIFDDANALGAHYATSSSLASGNLPRSAPGAPRPKLGLLGSEGFMKLADQMNRIGAEAKSAGLQYCYHNHNYEFEKMPDGSFGYDILVNHTDHDLVKFEIDCGWMCAGGGNPVTYLNTYPGRFRMLHIKEFQPIAHPVTSLEGPDRPLGTDLGQGFIDYKPIFAAGKRAGIEHAFSEQEDPFPISQMASAKAAYAFLAASK